MLKPTISKSSRTPKIRKLSTKYSCRKHIFPQTIFMMTPKVRCSTQPQSSQKRSMTKNLTTKASRSSNKETSFSKNNNSQTTPSRSQSKSSYFSNPVILHEATSGCSSGTSSRKKTKKFTLSRSFWPRTKGSISTNMTFISRSRQRPRINIRAGTVIITLNVFFCNCLMLYLIMKIKSCTWSSSPLSTCWLTTFYTWRKKILCWLIG